jgi:hypothetical protein
MVNTNLYRLMRSIIYKFVLKRSNLMYGASLIALMNPDALLIPNAPNIPLVMTEWLESIDYTLLNSNLVNGVGFLSSMLVYSIGVMTHDTITDSFGIMENSFVFTQAFNALSPELLNRYTPTFLDNPHLMHYIPHMLFQVYNSFHATELPIGNLRTTVNPTQFVLDLFDFNWVHYFQSVNYLDTHLLTNMLFAEAVRLNREFKKQNKGEDYPSAEETMDTMQEHGVQGTDLNYWRNHGPIAGLILYIIRIKNPNFLV